MVCVLLHAVYTLYAGTYLPGCPVQVQVVLVVELTNRKPSGSCVGITVLWYTVRTVRVCGDSHGQEGVQQAGVAGHLLDHPVLLLCPRNRPQLLLGENEPEPRLVERNTG